jgi:type I restriction enzyme R subunit
MQGMNEADTRAEYIDPKLKDAGWSEAGARIRREYSIAPGRVELPSIKRKPLSADYVLIYRNTKLAVVEAKPWDAHYTEGVGQAKDYATKLDVRFAYATNGQRIYQIDMTTGEEQDVLSFPSPIDLWNRTFGNENEWWLRFADVSTDIPGLAREERYYQDIATDRVLRAIASEKQRILLTLATGTGKTNIAFQIAWKLFNSRWNLSRQPSRTPRILFLADRNILADQAMRDFGGFPADSLVRIKPEGDWDLGTLPTNGSVFFTIFQTFLTRGAEGGECVRDYPPDFFDLVIIDECHRGGANDESSWRGILDYFAPAVQLGLTATPRRTDNVNTYAYFGDPVYSYSLRAAIADGFLTPFRVHQVSTTLDTYTYTPDDCVESGAVADGEHFEESDFNRRIEIEAREEYRVRRFLGMIDQNEKTLVFCATQTHALAIRNLVNKHKRSTDPHYCHRVTANDGRVGEQYLREFQDNEKCIPTILTTSHKLSTGVNARNVRNIVLMRPITSMVEFKQIIGRGTRLYEGKYYFTILDFVRAHALFNDPEWDGEPADFTEDGNEDQGEEQPNDDSDSGDTNGGRNGGDGDPPPPRPPMIRVRLADGKDRQIQSMVATTFWSPDGRPMSAHQFLQSLFGTLPRLFNDEDQLRSLWSDPSTRRALIENLAEAGFDESQMVEMQKLIDAENSDLFDVLSYVAFATVPVPREQRARHALKSMGSGLTASQREFVQFVLDQYVAEGVHELDLDRLPDLLKLRYQAIEDAVVRLGPAEEIRQVFTNIQAFLYQEAA